MTVSQDHQIQNLHVAFAMEASAQVLGKLWIQEFSFPDSCLGATVSIVIPPIQLVGEILRGNSKIATKARLELEALKNETIKECLTTTL